MMTNFPDYSVYNDQDACLAIKERYDRYVDMVSVVEHWPFTNLKKFKLPIRPNIRWLRAMWEEVLKVQDADSPGQTVKSIFLNADSFGSGIVEQIADVLRVDEDIWSWYDDISDEQKILFTDAGFQNMGLPLSHTQMQHALHILSSTRYHYYMVYKCFYELLGKLGCFLAWFQEQTTNIDNVYGMGGAKNSPLEAMNYAWDTRTEGVLYWVVPPVGASRKVWETTVWGEKRYSANFRTINYTLKEFIDFSEVNIAEGTSPHIFICAGVYGNIEEYDNRGHLHIPENADEWTPYELDLNEESEFVIGDGPHGNWTHPSESLPPVDNKEHGYQFLGQPKAFPVLYNFDLTSTP